MSFINLKKYTIQANPKSIQAMVNSYKEYKDQVVADPDFMWLLQIRNQTLNQIEIGIEHYQKKEKITALDTACLQEAMDRKRAFETNEASGRAFFREPNNSVNDLFWYEYKTYELEKYI